MTINLVNVAIVLFVFWNTGSNIFLAGWGLTIASAAASVVGKPLPRDVKLLHRSYGPTELLRHNMSSGAKPSS